MKYYACSACLTKEGKLHLKGCPLEHYSNLNNERLPFFVYQPTRCQRCDEVRDLFMVKDKVWKKVVDGLYREEDVLCENCFVFIAKARKIKVGKIKRLNLTKKEKQKDKRLIENFRRENKIFGLS